eukprot:763303-Hanusia_phi.AAC.16
MGRKMGRRAGRAGDGKREDVSRRQPLSVVGMEQDGSEVGANGSSILYRGRCFQWGGRVVQLRQMLEPSLNYWRADRN